MNYQLIIIGAGPAGLYAAVQAGLRNISTLVIETLPFVGGQMTTLYPEKDVYDIPGFPHIKAAAFIHALNEQLSPFQNHVSIQLNERVIHIEKTTKGFTVITNKAEYQSTLVLIATGAGSLSPQSIDSSLIEEQAVYDHIVYTIDDLSSYRNVNVTILGGGDSAVDWGNELLAHGAKVTLIHRRPQFRALPYSLDKFKLHGKLLAPYEIKRIQLTNKGLSLSLMSEGLPPLTITTDKLLVCYGFASQRIQLNQWGITTDANMIPVHSTMETNIKGMYAIGHGVSYTGKSLTIAASLGEAATAFQSVYQTLFPDRHLVYSSVLKK
jgi:ferredoxin/flavodoxin---NADP+ reductase